MGKINILSCAQISDVLIRCVSNYTVHFVIIHKTPVNEFQPSKMFDTNPV